MPKIINILKKYEEIIRYGFFGVLTTVVNFIVFYYFNSILETSYISANSLAIIMSILFAYVTNKKFVFKSQTHTLRQTFYEFLNFISLRLVSGIFDMASMYLLIDGIGIDTNISKILTQFIVVISNYIFSKLFIFKNK